MSVDMGTEMKAAIKRGLRQCIVYLTVISSLATCSAFSHASETSTSVKAVYIDVRSGPGRGYPVFHAIERDEEVLVLKRRTDWVKIKTQNRYQAVSGWVKTDKLFDRSPGQDSNDNRWYWSTAMGDFDGAKNLDISLGYKMTQYLSAEVNYGQATGDFSDIDYAYFRLNSRFRPIWRATPYFSIGAGQLNTSPNTKLVQSEQRSDTSMLAGFGLRSYLTRNFFMRIEYNQHLVLTSRESNEDVDQWLFGLTVNF